MLNVSKLFNKHLTGRVFGELAPYSISFSKCSLNWYTVPSLEKLARSKGFEAMDKFFGIPASYKETESDVVVRIFVYNLGNIVSAIDPLTKDFIGFEENKELNTPFINYAERLVSKIRGDRYHLMSYKALRLGEAGTLAIQISGKESKGLEDAVWGEDTLIFSDPYLILLNLVIMNEDDSLKQRIISDFSEIQKSLKLDIK